MTAARIVLALVVLGGLVVAGCARRPARVRNFPGDARDLLVVVPGIGATGATVEREGVLAAAREAGFSGDLVTVDVHIGHFLAGTVADRMAEVLPPPGRYRSVWLLGISLGGMASLVAASELGDRIDGVVVLGPWLGSPGMGARIAAAGGIARWEPPARPHWDAAVWAWWKHHPIDARPIVVAGYATDDPVNDVPTPLLDRLPEGRRYPTTGGHTWEVWRRLTRRVVAEVVVAGPRP